MIFRTLLAAIALSTPLLASDLDHVFVKHKEIAPKETYSQINIGPTYQRYQLEADGIGEFHGYTWGGNASYEYSIPKGVYINLGISAGAGDLNSVVGTSTISQIEFLYSQKIGLNFSWGRKKMHTFTPFIGFEYLWWRQHLAITDFELLRYTYVKPYLPFGFKCNLYANKHLSFGINYTYLFAIVTYLEIDVTIGSKWFLDRKNDELLEFPVTLKIRDWLHATATPFYRSVKMGASTAVTDRGLSLGIQPESYQIWGGKIDVTLRF
ncbi:MAG: outer membrane beta-barrel protein [Rhabdochlamydiaceae bacterium]|nr:outer membrane beta-barrel protein [Candidatus Amphrikana amoebophyrae]